MTGGNMTSANMRCLQQPLTQEMVVEMVMTVKTEMVNTAVTDKTMERRVPTKEKYNPILVVFSFSTREISPILSSIKCLENAAINLIRQTNQQYTPAPPTFSRYQRFH
jgi:hypothetical protein